MKLLFDENLLPKLPRLLATEFPNSLHIRDIGMKGCTDEKIWEYAKNNDFTVISKDADFISGHYFMAIPQNSFGFGLVTVIVTLS